jgi:hypothetical protein
MSENAKEVVGVVRDQEGRMTHVVGVNEDGSRWTWRAEEALDNTAEAWFFVDRIGDAHLVRLRRVEGEIVLWNDLLGWVTVPPMDL